MLTGLLSYERRGKNKNMTHSTHQYLNFEAAVLCRGLFCATKHKIHSV